jgi:hypothetical protein
LSAFVIKSDDWGERVYVRRVKRADRWRYGLTRDVTEAETFRTAQGAGLVAAKAAEAIAANPSELRIGRLVNVRTGRVAALASSRARLSA